MAGNSSSSLYTINLTLEEKKMHKIMGSYFNYQLPIVYQIKFKQKQSSNWISDQVLKHFSVIIENMKILLAWWQC